MAIDPTLRDALSAVTPASLARALTRAGVKAFSPHGLSPPRRQIVIGPAYTLRMIPARDDAAGDLAAAIDAVPEGAVVVIDAAGSGLALPFGADPGGAARPARRRRDSSPMPPCREEIGVPALVRAGGGERHPGPRR